MYRVMTALALAVTFAAATVAAASAPQPAGPTSAREALEMRLPEIDLDQVALIDAINLHQSAAR